MGRDESHFNVSVGSDGQSHKTVSTNHNLFQEKGEPNTKQLSLLCTLHGDGIHKSDAPEAEWKIREDVYNNRNSPTLRRRSARDTCTRTMPLNTHVSLIHTNREESKYENVSSPLTRYEILPQGWRQRQGILSISSRNLLKLSWLTLPTFRPVSCSSGFRFTEILSLLFWVSTSWHSTGGCMRSAGAKPLRERITLVACTVCNIKKNLK